MATTTFIKPEMLGGLPILSVIGTPRTMGAHIGQRLRSRLQTLAQYFTEQVVASSGKPEAISEELRSIARTIRTFEPALWMEIEAMAQAADMREEDLLLVHGYDDLIGHYHLAMPPTRSSFMSLTATQTADGHPRLVLAWHLDATLLPYVTVVRRMPAHGPANLTLTLAGLHPVCGISEAGIAVAKNELVINNGRPGHLTSHLLASTLTSPALEEAQTRIRKGPRFGGAAMHLLSGTTRESIELSGTEHHRLLDPIVSAPRVHTSLPVHPEVMQWSASGSDPTAKRRLEFLASRAVEASGADDQTIADWFGLGPGTTASALRSDEDPGFAPAQSVLAIINPATRELSIKRGGSPSPMASTRI